MILPEICGREKELAQAVNHDSTIFIEQSDINLATIQAGFACALHMHQPTIPAGKDGGLISNLQNMMENPNDGDNHNATVFAQCYGRMGEFIPELVKADCSPRIMLDYSGNLLWGLQQMGRRDILENLKKITSDTKYLPYVEWLGTMWSHAVATSTPIPDLKLQIQAWQHCYSDIFGLQALKRVKGFSPPEMHLPNHPDTLFEYIKAIKECGYRWILVQEHTVERIDGTTLIHDDKYLPNRLIASNSQGQEISITALIKTQGSDTKLVAQMQPYYEAKSRGRQKLGNIEIPCLVSQIADGENGGVMMNEFPAGYKQAWYKIKEEGNVVGFNGSEYIELIHSMGIKESDFPTCQAIGQAKIWQKVEPTTSNTQKIEAVIADLNANDPEFQMDGASWTNDLSWVQGYENVLQPMNDLSAKFHEKYDRLVEKDPTITKTESYRRSLLYLLLVETSCFRYWGQGTWTDYARKLYEDGLESLK